MDQSGLSSALDLENPFVYSRTVYGLFIASVSLLIIGTALLVLDLVFSNQMPLLLGTALLAGGAFLFAKFVRRGRKEHGTLYR